MMDPEDIELALYGEQRRRSIGFSVIAVIGVLLLMFFAAALL